MEKNNRMVGIHYDIYIYIYIYIHTYTHTFYIKEVDMNKKYNVSLICGGVKLKSKS